MPVLIRTLSMRLSGYSPTPCCSPSARHALVIDEQMRPLFAYLRALTLPTSVFATPDDWGATDLGERIERAATELTAMLRTGVGEPVMTVWIILAAGASMRRTWLRIRSRCRSVRLT
jgi:hypothetical protein